MYSFGFITDAIVTKLDSNVLFHDTSSNDTVKMELNARKFLDSFVWLSIVANYIKNKNNQLEAYKEVDIITVSCFRLQLGTVSIILNNE